MALDNPIHFSDGTAPQKHVFRRIPRGPQQRIRHLFPAFYLRGSRLLIHRAQFTAHRGAGSKNWVGNTLRHFCFLALQAGEYNLGDVRKKTYVRKRLQLYFHVSALAQTSASRPQPAVQRFADVAALFALQLAREVQDSGPRQVRNVGHDSLLCSVDVGLVGD